MKALRIGTRGSALAMWQAHHIASRLAERRPDIAIDLVEIVSTGDRIAKVPLSEVEGSGFFTAALEQALLDGRVDVAVHSCKDLPVADTAGLTIAAIPARGPVEDVLVARDGLTLAALPPGARLGTCSLRRTAQLRARRPDLEFLPLRGNVPRRVDLVGRGDLDAIVLARAGLVRLGLDAHITEMFSVVDLIPAPAQGALAVQCRIEDEAIQALLADLDDVQTRRAVTAERTVLHVLGGGCSVPVGAAATVERDWIELAVGVFDLAGGLAVRADVRGSEPTVVGESAARLLLERGAARLLAECETAGGHA
ncbi:MAG: hydroxymethylbilane synthase [Acidobacteria bacterium]|nr:hydroxymethylbilane synthase [Acidobacteriota bacterium]